MSWSMFPLLYSKPIALTKLYLRPGVHPGTRTISRGGRVQTKRATDHHCQYSKVVAPDLLPRVRFQHRKIALGEGRLDASAGSLRAQSWRAEHVPLHIRIGNTRSPGVALRRSPARSRPGPQPARR